MNILNFIIFMFGVWNHILSTNAAPCRIGDVDCIKDTTNDILRIIYDGVPDIGIEPIEPSFFDTIDASLAGIQLIFKNATCTGMSKCVTSGVRMDSNILELSLTCPSLMMTSKYLAKGQVLILPIHGEGDAKFKSGKISITMLTKHKKVTKSDGKNHWQFAIRDIKIEAMEPIQFDLTNLFNGQKLLSDVFLMFAHENWKSISEVLLEPVLRPSLEYTLKKINKYLGTKTYEDFLSD